MTPSKKRKQRKLHRRKLGMLSRKDRITFLWSLVSEEKIAKFIKAFGEDAKKRRGYSISAIIVDEIGDCNE